MTSKILHNGEILPENCPVCGKENDGRWIHFCKDCWLVYIDYCKEKYKNIDFADISNHIQEFLAKIRNKKETVCFT